MEINPDKTGSLCRFGLRRKPTAEGKSFAQQTLANVPSVRLCQAKEIRPARATDPLSEEAGGRNIYATAAIMTCRAGQD